MGGQTMIKLKDARELTVNNLDRKIRRFCKKIDKKIKKAIKVGLTQVNVEKKEKMHDQIFTLALERYENEGYKVVDAYYKATISWADENTNPPKILSNDIYRIAKHYGFEAQSVLAIEEMSELTKAITKYKRVTEEKQPPSKSISEEEAIENIIEEIADVEIALEEVKYLLNIPEKKLIEIQIAKIKRTLDIMEEGK